MRPVPEESSYAKASNDAAARAIVRNRLHLIALAASFKAQTWTTMHTGLASRLSSPPVGPLYRAAVEVRPHPHRGPR